jgi:NAD(P)-dependent dehydrogenase (short-subunit alcohol dehydrogenase family)
LAEGFSKALREAGQFDVVINNAGSGHFGPAEFLTPEELYSQFQILVFAHVQLCQLALHAMQDQGGRIINVTSLASRLPLPFMSAYNAAKAAMAAFTMTLQLELAGSNVRLIDLQPADIRTDFNNAIERKEGDLRYVAKLKQAWRVVDGNLKKAPSPELVAQRILKLIDERNPPPRVTVGNSFQAIVAPLIFRFFPQRAGLWGLRKYYGI